MISSDHPASVSPLLTTEEAAEFLGVSENWLRYMSRTGQITAIKLPGSRRWKYSREDLIDLIKGDPAA